MYTLYTHIFTFIFYTYFLSCINFKFHKEPVTPSKKYPTRQKKSLFEDWQPQVNTTVSIEGQFTDDGLICFWICELAKKIKIEYVLLLILNKYFIHTLFVYKTFLLLSDKERW